MMLARASVVKPAVRGQSSASRRRASAAGPLPAARVADRRTARSTSRTTTRQGRTGMVCLAAAETSDVPATGNKTAASPETLCKLAREFTETGSGYFSPYREELFADDFVFRGPVVGPLAKKDYLDTMDAFKIYKSFPDIQSNSWGYSVDPQEPNRVWFFVRQTGTNTGPITFGELFSLPATNKKAMVGPEAYSILFDDNQKVRLLTVGYACDFDAPNTNCNKFGAAVGLTAAVGVTPPGGSLFTAMQKLVGATRDVLPAGPPWSTSKWEDIPVWYKAYVPRRIGAEDAPGY
eukprot:jgi/Tetstr1/424318/TSEL_014885.t1